MGYSCKIENEADFSKARVEDVDASYKDLVAVCDSIRRRPAENAVAFLEEASVGKKAILYRTNNKGMGHRAELGGHKGRWPMKECKIVLKCLKSAIANAKEKGLSEELIVSHVCANKRHSYSRYAPKGRRNVSKLETARVEIVLREKFEAKRKRVDELKKAAEAKPAAAQAKEKKPAPTAPAAQTTALVAHAAPVAQAAPAVYATGPTHAPTAPAAPREIQPKPDAAEAKPAAAKKADVAKKKEVD